MQEGQKVKCVTPQGYAFTHGKVYTVLSYEPSFYDAGANFTWPAYVGTVNDDGKIVKAHAHRFVEVTV